MSGEETVIKEEKTSSGVEKVTIFQMGEDFANIESSPLLTALEEIGLTPDEFRDLVSGDFKDARKSFDGEASFNGTIEKFHVNITQIDDKEIEVASCFRKEDGIEPPSEFDLQLRQNQSAYKILVGQRGEAVLRLPKVEPAGLSLMHMYVPTDDGQDIPFKRGTVAIIQAPAVWSFASSKAGFEYLYISHPPHTHVNDVVTV